MSKDYLDKISCHDFVIVDNDIYFSAVNYNALYRWNCNEDKPEYLMSFPNEKINLRHLHGAAYMMNGKIYFAPMNGENVAIYDLKKKSINSINISDWVTGGSKYYSICANEEKIYMIPSRAEYIIEIDTSTDMLAFHNEWAYKIDIEQNRNLPAIKQGTFIRRGKMYIPYVRNNYLIEVDLEKYNTRIIEVGECKNGFTDAYYNGKQDIVWLLQNRLCGIFSYSFTTGESKLFELKKTDMLNNYSYIKMIQMGEELIVIPYQEKMFISLNMQSGMKKIMRSLDSSKTRNEWGAYYYSAVKISEKEFVALSAGDGKWEIYNYDCGMVKEFDYMDQYIIIRKHLFEKRAIKESETTELSQFVHYLVE